MIGEASIHLPRRGRVYVASFTGPAGGQIWRSTGSSNPEEAMVIAREFEAAARSERLKSLKARGAGKIYNRRSGRDTTLGLTQAEVARVMGLSERAVREIEKRALRKLARHPLLRELWHEYESSELTEESGSLTAAEIRALLGLVRTRGERASLLKLINVVRTYSVS
jgi:hypothetical protein